LDSTIFFSWQSDVRAAACRTLIQDALQGAVTELASEGAVAVEPVIDRDTQNTPGSPDIGQTIFGKIDNATVFVADVTIVGVAGERPTPNPNVLIELGYALKALGEPRIILVQNTALGGPEQLPFDLRQKRVLRFTSAPESSDRSSQRRELQRQLKDALTLVLRDGRSPKAEIDASIGFKRLAHSTGDIHHYDLDIRVKNISRRRIDDWEVDVDFPTPLMEPNVIVAARVASQSNNERSVIRAQGREMRKPLRPGEEHNIRLGYFVDDDVFHGRKRGQAHYFDELVRVRVLVDGSIAAELEKPIRDLQEF
jgi:hypothetical protein